MHIKLMLLNFIILILIGGINYVDNKDTKKTVNNNQGIENSIVKKYGTSDTLIIDMVYEHEHIHKLMNEEMIKYFEMVISALDNEQVDLIKLFIVNNKNEKLLEFTYSRTRINQIEKDITIELFLKHLENKGTDVLNNADEYRIYETIKHDIKKEYSDRLYFKES